MTMTMTMTEVKLENKVKMTMTMTVTEVKLRVKVLSFGTAGTVLKWRCCGRVEYLACDIHKCLLSEASPSFMAHLPTLTRPNDTSLHKAPRTNPWSRWSSLADHKMHIHSHTYMHTHTCVHTYMRLYIRTARTYVRTYVHTYIHTYIHNQCTHT